MAIVHRLTAMLRRSLQQRFEQLRLRLSEQVQTLPLGNDSWLETERELLAVERALARMPLCES